MLFKKTKRKKKVSLPDDYVMKLAEAGEIRVDEMGRVRGFDLYIKRMMKRGGFL